MVGRAAPLPAAPPLPSAPRVEYALGDFTFQMNDRDPVARTSTPA
ncbi:MAG: hypothetical protein U0802_21425 [Candidatus Binatia bacterium]